VRQASVGCRLEPLRVGRGEVATGPFDALVLGFSRHAAVQRRADTVWSSSRLMSRPYVLAGQGSSHFDDGMTQFQNVQTERVP
jgi:hypothetical protein